ncbi:hypothetical protein ACFX11_030862 [Malus domestica]
MEISVGVWAAVVLGGLPLLGLLFWWWNELRYVLPLKLQRSATGAKLLTGLLGFPFIGGELLPFLWYFKFLCRPNEFINAKRAQYAFIFFNVLQISTYSMSLILLIIR